MDTAIARAHIPLHLDQGSLMLNALGLRIECTPAVHGVVMHMDVMIHINLATCDDGKCCRVED